MRMINLETLSGEPFQTIHLNEDDRYYKDILKYVKKPTKYSELDKDMKKEDIKKICTMFTIYVTNETKLFVNGNQLNLDDEIDFDFCTLKIVPMYTYFCFRYHYENRYEKTYLGDYNLEGQLYDLVKSDMLLAHEGWVVWDFYDQLPYELKNEELTLIALGLDPYVIRYIPNELKTEKICKLAVPLYGTMLEFVPDSLKTQEICNIAVKNNPDALKFVPDELKTEKMCLRYIFKNHNFLHIPDNMKTEKLCKIAVSLNGTLLEYVPKNIITYEICEIAISKYTSAMQYVLEDMKTEELCKTAVTRNGNMLQYVPDVMKTEELCRIAVRQDGSAIQYVPQYIITEELYQIAIMNCPYTFCLIPPNMQTPKLLKLCNLVNSFEKKRIVISPR